MEEQALVRELGRILRSAKGWMTFLGVLSILYGAFSALSLIGLLFAWVPVWAGVVLIQAGNAARAADDGGDTAALRRAVGKLKTYFVIWGVFTLVMLLLMLPLILFGFGISIFGGVGGMSGMTTPPV